MLPGTRRWAVPRQKTSEQTSKVPDDPATLAIEASKCESQELWFAAIELRLKVLRLHQGTLGDDHHETLTAMHLLANVYDRNDKLDKAEEFYLKVMQGRRRTLGESHIHTIESTRQLALCYVDQGQFEDAERYYLSILPVCKDTLGPIDPQTIEVIQELSATYLEQGQTKKAKLLEVELFEALKKHFGERHPGTVASKKRLNDLSRQKQQQEGNMLSSPVAESPGSEEGEISYKPEDRDSAFESSPSVSNEDMPGVKYLEVNGPNHVDHRLPVNRVKVPLIQTPTNLAYPVSGSRIGSSISIEEAFALLAKRGCLNITHRLDLNQTSNSALSGGTFGAVWKGALKDGAAVAIKCLRLDSEPVQNLKLTMLGTQELYYWSKLEHSNVLELMGVALFNDHLSMISPWMENGTLRAYIAKNPNADHLPLCWQVAEGLAYLHEKGMVHGDLKALNILVSDDVVAKITDFGGSAMPNASLAFSASHSHSGGTIRWMAPELLGDDAGSTGSSKEADVYALGMTILEALTGDFPYSDYRGDGKVVLDIVQGKPPRRLPEVFPPTDFGEEKWKLLLTCWEMDPSDRPAASAVGNQLRHMSAMKEDITTNGQSTDN